MSSSSTLYQDLLNGDFLEVIEEFFGHGEIKCVAFNHHGNLLAAGCSDGRCVIWDFQTREISKILWDKDCIAAITSICWSKLGHRILVSAVDKSLTLWDSVKGDKLARSTLQRVPMQAHLHPGSAAPSDCLACPLSSAPLIVDLTTANTVALPVALSGTGIDVASCSRGKFSSVSTPVTPTAACFNECGDLAYVGNSKGEILIICYERLKIMGMIQVPGGAMIKKIGFSANGQYLHTNSNDRVIRIYASLLPLEGALHALDDTDKEDAKNEVEKLKVIGSRCLALLQELRSPNTKVHWKASCISGNGEWVAGASASKGDRKIYVWDRDGHLVIVLEGPTEMLIDLVWHPVNPVLLVVSLSGLVYIWGNDCMEDWSAFSPESKDDEESVEPEEHEDFDLMLKRKNSAGKWTRSSSRRLEKAGQYDYPRNLVSGSFEEVGRGTYLRIKRKCSEKVSNSETDHLMKPPSK